MLGDVPFCKGVAQWYVAFVKRHGLQHNARALRCLQLTKHPSGLCPWHRPPPAQRPSVGEEGSQP